MMNAESLQAKLKSHHYKSGTLSWQLLLFSKNLDILEEYPSSMFAHNFIFSKLVHISNYPFSDWVANRVPRGEIFMVKVGS